MPVRPVSIRNSCRLFQLPDTRSRPITHVSKTCVARDALSWHRGRRRTERHDCDHQNLTYVDGSVNDSRVLGAVLADVEEVYHLAAAIGVALIPRQPVRTIETNIYPTQWILMS